jgi:glycosyltransferase involved in cell wall biosynthesis
MIANPLFQRINQERNSGQFANRAKLLFLACYFPPVQAIGAVRTGNIARYLAKLGWEVTVITPHPYLWRNVKDSEKISIELDAQGIHRILTDHRWRCLMPEHLTCRNRGVGWIAGGICRMIARHLELDMHVGWLKEAERACSSLTPNDVDIILASGHPYGAFRVAKNLSNRLGRPYVLDYRDPWTANPHHHGRPPGKATIKEEASLLQGCAAVTVVSPSWGADLDRCYGVGAKVHVITNGYDPDEMAAVKPYDFGHCAIVYTGIFRAPRRVISPFMAALKCLKEFPNGAGRQWYFHYYGDHQNHVRKEAVRFGVDDRIVLHGVVPRHEALSAVKGARLTVVVSSIEEEASSEMLGMVPAKVFEAIGLGTPVLLIAPHGSDATALLASTGLVASFTGSETQRMGSFLKDVICGQTPQLRNSKVCSWTTISKNLDAVLRRCLISPHVHRDTRGADRDRDGANMPG